MTSSARGHYRRRSRRAVRTLGRGVLSVMVSLSLLAGTMLVLTSGALDSPRTSEAVGQEATRPVSDRDHWSSRGHERSAPGTPPGPGGAPTHLAEATLTAKVVNGRAQPEQVESPQAGAGTYSVVPGESDPAANDDGRLARYLVEVEDGLPFDPDDFAEAVHAILTDKRGWGGDGWSFERVDDGRVDFRVALSSPDLTDAECHPLRTRGKVSCWNGERAVINAQRWGVGADTYGDDLLGYREYLINHEVGHALGKGHVNCPDDGEPAPVMVQQTKSLEGCVQNPWPFPG